MRLALISLLMIPLTLGCGTKGDGEVECQDLCERRLKGESSSDQWSIHISEGVEIDAGDLQQCKNLPQTASCEHCNEQMQALFTNEFNVSNACAWIFMGTCGDPGGCATDGQEYVIEEWGSWSALEDFCTQECDD